MRNITNINYADAADAVENVAWSVAFVRRTLRISLRDVHAESGVSVNTLCRLENGGVSSAETIVKLFRWLETKQTGLIREVDVLNKALGR